MRKTARDTPRGGGWVAGWLPVGGARSLHPPTSQGEREYRTLHPGPQGASAIAQRPARSQPSAAAHHTPATTCRTRSLREGYASMRVRAMRVRVRVRPSVDTPRRSAKCPPAGNASTAPRLSAPRSVQCERAARTRQLQPAAAALVRRCWCRSWCRFFLVQPDCSGSLNRPPRLPAPLRAQARARDCSCAHVLTRAPLPTHQRTMIT